MASQKVANCFVAAGKGACETPNCLVITAYLSTPHSSKFARLAFDDFCLAIPFDDFLRNHQPLLFIHFSTAPYAVNDIGLYELFSEYPLT
jgi:hypothetical protein